MCVLCVGRWRWGGVGEGRKGRGGRGEEGRGGSRTFRYCVKCVFLGCPVSVFLVLFLFEKQI